LKLSLPDCANRLPLLGVVLIGLMEISYAVQDVQASQNIDSASGAPLGISIAA
jgi:hypothetical protein